MLDVKNVFSIDIVFFFSRTYSSLLFFGTTGNIWVKIFSKMQMEILSLAVLKL